MTYTAFKIRSEITYKIIAIIKSQKGFYAQEIGNRDRIDWFEFLDVSSKDLGFIKKESKFVNRTGHIDSSTGQRTRVLAQLEFLEE